ncbi:MAG: hypothetical protein K6U74_02860 [Firmicutes bacterium]|nr:hypothetical protein [Bacillota bacterium]
MLSETRRISIFTGNFGSGKTEIALNFAQALRRDDREVTVVDLDIVNPYFRSRIVREYLISCGIKVVSPEGRLSGADVPALPPAIRGVLDGYGGYGVFDVGGDDLGATVLGRFQRYMPEGAFNLFLVVNTRRPFTRDADGIIRQLEGIEKAARLKVGALVSNTNLGAATDLSVILDGHRIVSEAAAKIGLPVAFLGVRRDLAVDLADAGVPVLPLDIFMKPPWYDGGEAGAADPLLRILPR